MSTLVFATNNAHKLEEARLILPDVRVLSLSDIGLSADIPEDGMTLSDNSMFKASFVADWIERHVKELCSRYPEVMTPSFGCFADDTGLEIAALNGAPGVFTARWAGEPANPAANRHKALCELNDKTDRRARFRTVVTYITWNGEARAVRQFEGIVNGTIATEEHGEHGFGYDPLFIPEGFDRTFAQLPAETKNSISHRARALAALAEVL